MPKEHTRYECGDECPRTRDVPQHCQFCDGGLFSCTMCHCGEGTLATECPDVEVSPDDQELIMHSFLDYRDGSWCIPPARFHDHGPHVAVLLRLAESAVIRLNAPPPLDAKAMVISEMRILREIVEDKIDDDTHFTSIEDGLQLIEHAELRMLRQFDGIGPEQEGVASIESFTCGSGTIKFGVRDIPIENQSKVVRRTYGRVTSVGRTDCREELDPPATADEIREAIGDTEENRARARAAIRAVDHDDTSEDDIPF